MNSLAINVEHPDASDSFPAGTRTAYRVQGVGKNYYGTVVLSDINLDFMSGEIHGIIGKNGAGKSTLVDIMHGSNTPSEGTLTIFDEPSPKVSILGAIQSSF